MSSTTAEIISFFGASSMKRLPPPVAMTGEQRRFESLTVSSKNGMYPSSWIQIHADVDLRLGETSSPRRHRRRDDSDSSCSCMSSFSPGKGPRSTRPRIRQDPLATSSRNQMIDDRSPSSRTPEHGTDPEGVWHSLLDASSAIVILTVYAPGARTY